MLISVPGSPIWLKYLQKFSKQRSSYSRIFASINEKNIYINSEIQFVNKILRFISKTAFIRFDTGG